MKYQRFILSSYLDIGLDNLSLWQKLNSFDEIDRKIDVTAMQFLLVENRHQSHGWTLIGSGANGLGIHEWEGNKGEVGVEKNESGEGRSKK